MQRYFEKINNCKLPTLSLRGIVAFPEIPISLEISFDCDIKAVNYATEHKSEIFLCSLSNICEDPKPDDHFKVGCICKIKQALTLPEGNMRVVLEGSSRASVVSFEESDGFIFANLLSKTISVNPNTIKCEALIREAYNQFKEFSNFIPKFSNELDVALQSIKDPSLYADYIAFNILINYKDKQTVLEEFDPIKRIELVSVIMNKEIEVLQVEVDIHKKVRDCIDSNQKEFYLREQLKAIHDELGDNEEDEDDEVTEYMNKINSANLPKEVHDKLVKETKKLSKTPYTSSEASVIRNYLDTCLEIPWDATTEDTVDIANARSILDKDHDGLKKVKDRLLEFLAVKQLNPTASKQIICLVGPPGTGKTSICESIARAMGRKYVRVCLGGIRDEADIRGHRKTYIGSMPGRIVTALVQAGVRNPLILLDEIDKMSRDAHGDPASALLEVLDDEQNCHFRDHFIELPIDLSECIFIATANELEDIPIPLADRMDLIELDIYNRYQKLAIAKNHLIKKQRKENGLKASQFSISDDAIFEIIDYYTAEAGVRNLNREIANLCRKAAVKIVENKESKIRITKNNLKDYLGPRKILPDKISKNDEIGCVNGLAYTAIGGDMLKVEASTAKGDGKLELTGSLGDVMKESAKTGITYIKSHAKELGINEDIFKEIDIHINVPEGAVPKDGPSAGVTMVTAMVSELTKTPVKRTIAMTGEVTLRGNVLAIGGLKEKTMAAYKSGVKTVIIPKDNEKDLNELDPVVKKALKFELCSNVSEVLNLALKRKKSKR